MFDKTLERLEYHKFKEIIGRYILTETGRKTLDNLTPAESDNEIHHRLRLLKVILSLVKDGLRLDFSRVPEGVPLNKIKAGAFLTPPDLLKIADFIDASQEIYEALLSTELAEELTDPSILTGLKQEIRKTISPDGTIKDSASPKLAQIRKAKKEAEKEVLSRLNILMRKYSQKGLLREDFVTIKNGRYVLPVKSHVKVEGVVHGFSVTEETSYVEPIEVIDVQNRYKRKIEEENEEINRILSELSQKAHRNSLVFERVYEELGKIELYYASALYANENNAIVPEISTRGQIAFDFVNVYHPILLDEKGYTHTVPLSLKFGKSVLLISGPNAGGKTVVLKTIGLITLLAKSGLPVIGERVFIKLPNHVYAIGFTDEQDIKKGESSFTSIIHDVVEVLNSAKGGDLVLFDEVLSSTDPAEGSALGYAILKNLADKDITVVANTHLSPLKDLVSETENMVNASMGFDPATGMPTYTLEIDSVGESHALEIAERVGIPEDLIQYAYQVLYRFNEGLAKLKAELARKEMKLSQWEKILEEREKKIEYSIKQRLVTAKLEARKILEQVKKEADTLRKELRRARAANHQSEQIALKIKREVQKREKEISIFSKKAKELIAGKEYRIKPFGWIAKFAGEKDGKYFIKIGETLVEVPRDSFYES